MKLPRMPQNQFSSWEDEQKYFKLEYIPEMVRYLCYKGLNYQEILYNGDVVDLLRHYNFPEDFWAFLVKTNYEQLFYIWAFQGTVNINTIIERLENSPDTWTNDNHWNYYLSPLEPDKLKNICSYKKFSLISVYDGALFPNLSNKERFLSYLYQVRTELVNFYEVFLPFPIQETIKGYKMKEVSQ